MEAEIKMKKTAPALIASVLCVVLSILALTVYFVRISQNSTMRDATGALLLVPTVLSIPGLFFAWAANKEWKSPLAIGLIVIHTLSLFSIWLMHFFGTLLLGV